MSALINSILIPVLKRRLERIERIIRNPHEIQRRLILEHISGAKQTAFGREHGFADIGSIEQFKERVPVRDYEQHKPYIERMMKGEQSVLWPSTIKWFAKSSGTTSDKSKFIPVTKEALRDCHFKGGRDTVAIYARNFPKTKLFSGKTLIMGGSTQINRLDERAGSKYGDVSAVMMSNMPRVARIVATPSLDILLMDEWEEKLRLIAEKTVRQNITQVVGVPTWTVVLIKRLFEMTGKDNLAEIWPNLELYVHGGVSFTPYREQFRQLIRSEKMRYLEVYNASEGFFSMQYDLTSPDMLLMPDYGIFYEFMPMEEVGKESPRTLPLDEVVTGKHYAPVISTNAGLWRYLIGDTIQFTSTNPYMIRVSGRVKHFINAFGEEVIVDNADEAIAKASEATGALVRDYTAGPIYMSEAGKGGHEWIIEFEKQPDDFRKFSDVLDKHLQSINSDYEAKRHKSIALAEPVVHDARPGTFYEWMRQRGKLGGQNKVPRLANDRQYVEQLLAIIAEQRTRLPASQRGVPDGQAGSE